MNLEANFTNSGIQPPTNGPIASDYVLATGPRAVRRLHLLHDVYSPAGKRLLLKAGLTPGMRVADFGCGIGAVTRMLAELVGPKGHVTGIDAYENQLTQASDLCTQARINNVSLWKA